MSEAVDEFVILLALIVGALGHLRCQAVQQCFLLADVGKGQFGLLTHGARVGQLHHLRQVTYRDTLGHAHHAIGGLLQPCQYLEHGTLARTVLAHEGYAVLGIDDITDPFKQWRSAKLYLKILDTYHSVLQNRCKISASRAKTQVYLQFSEAKPNFKQRGWLKSSTKFHHTEILLYFCTEPLFHIL